MTSINILLVIHTLNLHCGIIYIIQSAFNFIAYYIDQNKFSPKKNRQKCNLFQLILLFFTIILCNTLNAFTYEVNISTKKNCLEAL